ncbi:MAG: hypothetical protein ABSC30_07465 [Acidimicrobiales bacterium]
MSTGSHPQSQAPPSHRDEPQLERALARVRIDFPAGHPRPRAWRFGLAVLIAVAGSLAADRILVAIGTSLFPLTKGYVHFRFSDYGKLTVVGVIGACLAWPIVVRISSSPRWLFVRLATLVTLFLWLPDLWILWKGQPVRAVLVLIVMHLAIALVTYSVLVHLAPARRPSLPRDHPGP